MKPLRKKTFGTTRNTAVFHILSFCGFFLYFWLFGDTRLIYHAFGRFVDYPAFFTGWKFLGTAIDHPGGILEYVTGLLSQFYYYPPGGAIVITIVVSLTCLATAMLVGFAGYNSLVGIIAYAPAMFFLAMHNQCGHPLAVFVALLINLWALVLYEKIRPQSYASRCCFFLAMFVLLYFVAGACAFLFGILAAGYELFVRRRLLSGGLYILLTGLTPLVVGWYFDIRPMDIYLYLLPFDPRLNLGTNTAAKALYISIMCILLAVFVCQFFLSKRPSRKKSKKTPANTERIRLRWLIQPMVGIVAAIATVCLSAGAARQRLQADYYSTNAMWTELLEYANRFPIVTHDPAGNHNIIQALHHTGRLGEELFRYPQFKEGMFLPPRNKNNVRLYRRGISYIRLSLLLGRVNVAEKEAYEMLENAGEYPELLWNLAIINIAKGQPETARVFLEVLSRDLIHGNKARHTLKRLDDDPELGNDEEIIRLRSVMLEKDVTEVQSLEAVMSDLLEVNPHNKLAFEYMMLYYLKSKQVDKIAENMYRFGDFGYKKIPRHFEEAILLHLGKTREPLKSHGWKIDPQTYKTGDQFMAALKFNPPDRPSSARNLAPNFGNTYFFYYIFSQSGLGR
jgi:hypothetical protein